MDIDKIELLIKALELGSLSKVANEYSYTPSAVSHILDGIENKIGTRFIKRSYKGIEVEPGYEEVIENLRQIVNLQKQTIHMVSNIHKKEKSLTIATYASLSKKILPKILKSFYNKFPDTKVNIVVVKNVKKAYEVGSADILLGEKVEDEGACWKELISDPYVAVLPKSYSLSGESIRCEELYKQTFVMLKDSTISNYIDENRIDDIIKIESHDDSSVVQMVKEGLGVAVLPMLSVQDDENIVYAGLEPKLNRNLGLIYRERDFESRKEIRNFIIHIGLFDFETI